MHDDESVVSVAQLRHVINDALDSLREWTGDSVQLDIEFFWSLPPEATYDTYTPPQPEQLTLGQLSENWDNLVRFHASGDRVPTYALTWIAEILRALGHHAP